MSKKRGVLVWVLFALATILLLVSSLTVWAKRQLLDDQAWANSSTQLLANDEVRGVIPAAKSPRSIRPTRSFRDLEAALGR